MKTPEAPEQGGLRALLGAGLQHNSDHAEHAALARAVTAGAVAGAMAGAVAGASAAASVHAQSRQLGDPYDRADGRRTSRDKGGGGGASPATPSGGALPSPSGVAPPLLDSPGYGDWQRAYDDKTSAWYYYHAVTRETTWTPPPGWTTHKATGSLHGADLAMDLAQTLTLDDYLHKSGITQQLQHVEVHTPRGAHSSPPSLYARDTDIDTCEEVRRKCECCARMLRQLTHARAASRLTHAWEPRWKR